MCIHVVLFNMYCNDTVRVDTNNLSNWFCYHAGEQTFDAVAMQTFAHDLHVRAYINTDTPIIFY